MVCFGKTEDIPGLKNLWKQCFADKDAYIDAFFRALYQGENVLLEQENGMLMGASFFLPGKIYRTQISIPERDTVQPEKAGLQPEENRDWQQIRYVYALAVYPQFRGRGIAGRLLREAVRLYQSPLIAEPAEEGLVGGFYKPLGFSQTFYLRKQQIKMPQYSLKAAQIQPGLEIYPADAADYCRIRDRRFQKKGYVSWPEEHVAFAIEQHRESGGDALVLATEGREDLLLYYAENGQAVVTETTLSGTEAAAVLHSQLRQPCSTILLKSEAMLQHNEDSCYLTGMSLGMADDGGYLNITLD